MQYSSKLLKLLASLGLLLNFGFAQASSAVAIKKEMDQYIIDIKYPQGFKSSEVNSVIKKFIEKTQNQFMNDLADDVNTPADAPGKTGINIRYSVPYESKDALSVRFNISIYHRGAAHPANTVVVENFVDGHPIKLADLFISGSDYLKPIAAFCKQAIKAKKISNDKWIDEGTKPLEKNYEIWSFNHKGLAVIFNNYQVAAYVYGAQIVDVPFDTISSLLKPKVSTAVWSH